VTVERRIDARLFPPPAYSHVAVASGATVYTAGAVPVDAEGELVGEGDVAAQTRQVIDNLLGALETGGASAEDVVKMTVYVVATNNEPLITAWDVVRDSALVGAPSTLLGVSALGYAGQLVEIEAIAVVEAT
jgi:enamine deaminase RidA (YjgF/YER057c/UK114 family)